MATLLNRSTLALACAALMLTTAFAEPPEDGKRRGRRAGGGPGGGGSPLVAALDTNKDGKIDSEEISNAVTTLLTLDKNGDGELTPQELRPTRGGSAGGPDGERLVGRGAPSSEKMQQFFNRLDADGDGELKGDEIPQRMSSRLDQVDTNGDGAISMSEMKEAAGKRGGKDKGKEKGKGKKGKKGKSGKRNDEPSGTPGGDRPKRPSVEA